jgi:F1F0 ATPase subunit 2
MDAAVLIALSPDMALRAFGGFAAGALLGFAHFGSLWMNARLFASGGGVLRALGVQVLRFCLLIAVLGGLTIFGALALLSGTAGLWVARGVVLRRAGRAS